MNFVERKIISKFEFISSSSEEVSKALMNDIIA